MYVGAISIHQNSQEGAKQLSLVPDLEVLSSGHELSKSGPRDFFLRIRFLDFFLALLISALSGIVAISIL